MAVKITLPPRFAKAPVLAGIAFANREATVTKLGTHARAYFAHIGATLTDPDEKPESPFAAMTSKELREVAAEHGVDVPRKASKAQLVDAIDAHLANAAEETSSPQTED